VLENAGFSDAEIYELLKSNAAAAREQSKGIVKVEFYLKPDQEVSFSKTVGEADVYMFAGITGDLSSNHVNEEVMSRSKYKRRIAHGALMIGFMSTASTKMIDPCWTLSERNPSLARVRQNSFSRTGVLRRHGHDQLQDQTNRYRETPFLFRDHGDQSRRLSGCRRRTHSEVGSE
jgi:hypothetical protein